MAYFLGFSSLYLRCEAFISLFKKPKPDYQVLEEQSFKSRSGWPTDPILFNQRVRSLRLNLKIVKVSVEALIIRPRDGLSRDTWSGLEYLSKITLDIGNAVEAAQKPIPEYILRELIQELQMDELLSKLKKTASSDKHAETFLRKLTEGNQEVLKKVEQKLHESFLSQAGKRRGSESKSSTS